MEKAEGWAERPIFYPFLKETLQDADKRCRCAMKLSGLCSRCCERARQISFEVAVNRGGASRFRVTGEESLESVACQCQSHLGNISMPTLFHGGGSGAGSSSGIVGYCGQVCWQAFRRASWSASSPRYCP
eukprot:1674711-Rhodomonas_salina.2